MRVILDPYTEYDLRLSEAKGLYSLKSTDSVRQALIDSGFDFDRGEFARGRHKVTSKYSRKFKKLADDLIFELVRLTKRYLAEEISYKDWSEWVKTLLRNSYTQAFEYGLKSASHLHKSLSVADQEYIRSAVRQEMIYFNKVIDQIKRGKLRGNLERRLSAYAEALKHVYYSGRVVGSPSNMVVDWISPLDRATCKGCRFMSNHSPYLKDRLPTTPRAGNTPCLNRCRCRLVMRSVSAETMQTVRKSSRALSYYKKKLSAIKAGKS